MECQRCQSERVAYICARCRDGCYMEIKGRSDTGYPDLGIDCGDDIQFRYCLDCGQVQGKFPVELTYLEEGWVDESDRG